LRIVRRQRFKYPIHNILPLNETNTSNNKRASHTYTHLTKEGIYKYTKMVVNRELAVVVQIKLRN